VPLGQATSLGIAPTQLQQLQRADQNINSNGGNIVAAGAGNVVGTGGGSIIAAGGGNIIAAGAGN
jgi:hypothetical protein